MASVSKDDIPNVAGFMPDFWELMKKYYITEDDQHYWDALIDDSTKLDTRMGEEKERRLCHMLLLAYLEFLKEEASGI